MQMTEPTTLRLSRTGITGIKHWLKRSHIKRSTIIGRNRAQQEEKLLRPVSIWPHKKNKKNTCISLESMIY